MISKMSQSNEISYAAALDLGATNLRAALIDNSGEILCLSSVTVRDAEDGAEIQMTASNMITELIEKTKIQPSVIGVSTAGPVDLKTGSVVNSPNMKCSRIFITEPLEKRFHIPAVMTTDCKAAVTAEKYFGGAKGNTIVYITISTGIGAGVITGGRLISGADGNAGEVGHITVDTKYNLKCRCGGSGHWEAYSSGSGIPKFFSVWRSFRFLNAKCSPNAELSAKQILDAAEIGSPLCMEFCQELAKINGRGLSNVINAYNPDEIILDGPVVQNYPSLVVEKMIDCTDRYLKMPVIRISELGGNAPVLGAAYIAFQRLNRVE